MSSSKYAEKLKNMTGWALAQKVELLFDDMQESLQRECQSLLPSKICLGDMLEELERITPPLRADDRKLAEAELAKVDKGELNPEQSWVLRIILPALRGEKDCDELDLDALEAEFGEAFPFSASFATKLVRGKLHISPPGTNAATQPEDKNSDTPASGVDIPQDPVFLATDSVMEDGESDATQESMAPDAEKPLTDASENSAIPAAETEEVCTESQIEEERDARLEVDADLDSNATLAANQNKLVEGEEGDGNAESESALSDLEDNQEEIYDYDDYEGIFEPLGKNAFKKEVLNEYGNIGALAEEAESLERPKRKGRSRRKPVQENTGFQLETLLKKLMNRDADLLAAESAESTDEEMISSLLNHDDTAGLYWYVVTRGTDCAVPEWLAEMLHIGSKMTARRPDERDRFASLLKHAIMAESIDDRQTVLLAAAILRPAMIMPMPDMITALQTLENSPTLRSVSSIFKNLKEIVFRDQPVPLTIPHWLYQT